MVKKIINTFVLTLFLLSTYNSSYAAINFWSTANLNVSPVIRSKERIKNMENWTVYLEHISKIELLVKNQSDIEVLKKMKISFNNKKNSSIGWNYNAYEIAACIWYIIDERISILEEAKKKEIINQINTNNLSAEDTKKINDEIVKVQLTFFNSGKNLFEKITSDLKKSLNSESTWNIKLNVEWSWAMFWNWKWEISIKDIKSKQSWFDSQFQAQLDLFLEENLRWNKNIKTQFSSFIDFIKKDENVFLLLKNLQYSWLENFDRKRQISGSLNKMKELWNTNTYVKIEDKQTAQFLKKFKDFDFKSKITEMNKVLATPMFKPYKKEWEKYYITPTKDFCNAMKSMKYIFSNYGNKTCTDSEYNRMVTNFSLNWNIYIAYEWSEKYFWYDLKDTQEQGYIKIYYNDNKITKVYFRVESISWSDIWNFAYISYITWKKFDFNLTVIRQKINVSFMSTLTYDNKFNTIKYTWNFPNEWFSSNFSLENKKFNWGFLFNDWWSDWTKVQWSISGSLNNEYLINSLNFSINSKIARRRYNYDSSYDYSKWPPSYTTEYNEFSLLYTLSNEIISWNISYKKWWKDVFSVKSNWKYKKWYFELNNAFSVAQYNQSLNWNINIKYDWDINENSFTLFIELISNMGYMKINLLSDSKLQYKENIEIIAPTNYKDAKDLK